MKNISFIVVIIFFVLGFIYLLVSKLDTVDYKLSPDATIVAFGDSLTAGYGSTKNNDYVSILSQKIGRPIINLGVSGDTTELARKRVGDVIKRKPELVIVFLGGNDLLRRVSIEDTFSNLDAIVSEISSSTTKVVLVAVPGSVFGDPYERRYKDIAEKYDAIYVKQFLSGLVGKKDLMYDAIHPNDEGYKIVAEKIYQAIKDTL